MSIEGFAIVNELSATREKFHLDPKICGSSSESSHSRLSKQRSKTSRDL